MVTAHGLFEAHITVANVGASIAFYRDALGLELAHAATDRQAAFFWIGGRGRSMLGIWGAGSAPQKVTTHLAFAASLDDVLAAPRSLRGAGIAPLDFHGNPTDEPVVLCWMPAASVYLRDPDDHLLEYIAMLPDLPVPEWGVLPWGVWRARNDARGAGRAAPRL